MFAHRARFLASSAILLVALSALGQAQIQRRFRVINECDFNVWVGALGTPGANPGIVPRFWDDEGLLRPGQAEDLIIPSENWQSSRIWGRTECNWTRSGQIKCLTGDCDGRKICQNATSAVSGFNPVTLAEFTLGSWSACAPPCNAGPTDVYDVSNVDGFNIPMTIEPVAPNAPSPWVDLNRRFLNCGVAGECFIGIDWKTRFLRNCPKRNRIFGLCTGNRQCPGDSKCVGSTGLCINGTNLNEIRACVSDSVLASLPMEARGTNPPADWPLRSEFNEYACPASAYFTYNCPSNFRLPSGISPYKNWPEWFSGGCWRGSYAFTYDDEDSTYGCQTYNRSNTYNIRFCPRGTPTSPAPTMSPSAVTQRPTQQPTLFPATPAPTGSGTGTTVLRINAGSQTGLTDSTAGITWTADAYFVATNTDYRKFTVPIANGASLPALYQSYRTLTASVSQSAPQTMYNIPVTAGSYTLRLFFAEVYFSTCTVGQRVFDVFVNGNRTLYQYDICKEVPVRTAVAEDMPVYMATSGQISIALRSWTVNNPQINAIQLIRLPAGTSSTNAPTQRPTSRPTNEPTVAPSEEPTAEPSQEPTPRPTNSPTSTRAPTARPSAAVQTSAPTDAAQTSAPTAAAPTGPIDNSGAAVARIDCGASRDFTDSSSGNVWSADYGFNAAISASRSPAATIANGGTSGPVFASYRTVMSTSPIAIVNVYNISVPNGNYVLRLHFAEVYYNPCNAGHRVFDVFVEGDLALPAFDICASAGRSNTVVSRNVPVSVTDGAITVATRAVTPQNPQFNAIEVFTASPASSVVLNLDSGSSSASDGWAADAYFTTSTSSRSPSGMIVAGGSTAAPASIYTSYRISNQAIGRVVMYNIPLASGPYTVRLHFAEIYFSPCTPGARVFDVLLENIVVLTNYDMCVRAGGARTAVYEDIPVVVTDGVLVVEVVGRSANAPHINGITVLSSAAPKMVSHIRGGMLPKGQAHLSRSGKLLHRALPARKQA